MRKNLTILFLPFVIGLATLSVAHAIEAGGVDGVVRDVLEELGITSGGATDVLTGVDDTGAVTNDTLRRDASGEWRDSSALQNDGTNVTATGNLTANGSLAADQLDLDPAAGTPAHQEGRVFYDASENAVAVYNDEAEITLQVGQEQWVRVRNATGSTITNGQVVYITGSQANLPTVALAQADALATSCVLGVATHDIENASNGYVTVSGQVHDLDTQAFNEGDALYLSASTPGALTTTVPASPNLIVLIGHVLRAHPSQGEIQVGLLDPNKTLDAVARAGNTTAINLSTTGTISVDSTDIEGLAAGTDGQVLTIQADGDVRPESVAAETLAQTLTAGNTTDNLAIAAAAASPLELVSDGGTLTLDAAGDVTATGTLQVEGIEGEAGTDLTITAASGQDVVVQGDAGTVGDFEVLSPDGTRSVSLYATDVGNGFLETPSSTVLNLRSGNGSVNVQDALNVNGNLTATDDTLDVVDNLSVTGTAQFDAVNVGGDAGAVTGQVAIADGLGAIDQIEGPTDQEFGIASGGLQDLHLKPRGGNGLQLQATRVNNYLTLAQFDGATRALWSVGSGESGAMTWTEGAPLRWTTGGDANDPRAAEIKGGLVALTDATPTTVFAIALAAGEACGGVVKYSIRALDASDTQALSGTVSFSVVAAAAGLITASINPSGTDSTATSAGTLTLTGWTVDTTADGSIEVAVEADTSLTPTTMEIRLEVSNCSPEVVTIQ